MVHLRRCAMAQKVVTAGIISRECMAVRNPSKVQGRWLRSVSFREPRSCILVRFQHCCAGHKLVLPAGGNNSSSLWALDPGIHPWPHGTSRQEPIIQGSIHFTLCISQLLRTSPLRLRLWLRTLHVNDYDSLLLPHLCRRTSLESRRRLRCRCWRLEPHARASIPALLSLSFPNTGPTCQTSRRVKATAPC